MRNTADTLLAENRENNGGPNSVSHPFVGTDGIMMKAATMDAIKNYDNLNDKGMVLDKATHGSVVGPGLRRGLTLDAHVRPPKIQLIPPTKSAEAGINGKFLKHGKVSGFPSSFYEVVQQLGRLD